MNPGLEYVKKLGKGYRMGENAQGEQVSVIAYVEDDTLVAGSMEELQEMVRELSAYYESFESKKEQNYRKMRKHTWKRVVGEQ